MTSSGLALGRTEFEFFDDLPRGEFKVPWLTTPDWLRYSPSRFPVEAVHARSPEIVVMQAKSGS